jgi:hypothetical protein
VSRASLQEIEEGHANCKPAELGRMQFHDPDFAHDESSITGIQRADVVKGWKCSRNINPNGGLFADGTDPDDVFQGQLADGWLLSAISIVAASGGVGDDRIDPLIDNIFYTKETTSTGVYMVRLYKNAQWETVTVDDFFPVLDTDAYGDSDSAGAAFAYSKGFQELWVPILEKAYAKYHGGYSALEFGYVHHALHDLTGGDSEEIFLAEAARGANKYMLWTNMMKYRENHYLMGAGTVMPNSNDHELMESGLVFGAAYVIYDVRFVDGHRLVKLRNPPGDHGEWKGDWGDKSPLWTRRLKLKLGWSDEDDGTFWMSFDDFCFAFRSLYLCRWFDPAKWYKDVHSGWWKGPTAQGLPTPHNLKCKLENNPQFQIIVRRPTDVCLVLSQSVPDFALDNNPHPIAAYIVKDEEHAPLKHIELPQQPTVVGLDAVSDSGAGAGAGAGDGDGVGIGIGAGAPKRASAVERGELRERTEQQNAAVLQSLGRETGTSVDYAAVKSHRVKFLTNLNVAMSSGAPIRQREIRVYGTLAPGAYTALLVCYQAMMEGPFTATVYSNHRVYVEALWPPAQSPAPVPTSKVGVWMHKARAYVERLKTRFIRAHVDDHDEAMRKLEEEREADLALAAMKEAAVEAEMAATHARAKVVTSWVEQYDAVAQAPYYVNIETGESQVCVRAAGISCGVVWCLLLRACARACVRVVVLVPRHMCCTSRADIWGLCGSRAAVGDADGTDAGHGGCHRVQAGSRGEGCGEEEGCCSQAAQEIGTPPQRCPCDVHRVMC